MKEQINMFNASSLLVSLAKTWNTNDDLLDKIANEILAKVEKNIFYVKDHANVIVNILYYFLII